jgi:hypothetical protein
VRREGCRVSRRSDLTPAEMFYWEDLTGHYYAECSIARGDGYWPSMLSFDIELDGTITAGCARELAAMLIRAADACDASTAEVSQ